MKIIDASNMYYRDLNAMIDIETLNEKNITVKNVYGQRYIGRGLSSGVRVKVFGVAGNDMASYMNGAELEVFGNAQDALGNTMNSGKIVVHGNAGDTLGYAMRGGQIYVEGNVGYRVGIHMKEYKEMKPIIVVGGKAGDFLGEYMAGGAILVLGLNLDENEDIIGKFCATGMHGGVIYFRGKQDLYKFGKEAVKVELEDSDTSFLKKHIDVYAKEFDKDLTHIDVNSFSKYLAINKNPYSNMYCIY
jgi:glutamate synthase domain-containing protein 3